MRYKQSEMVFSISSIAKLVVDQQSVGIIRGVNCDSINDHTVPTLSRILESLPTLHHIGCYFNNFTRSHNDHLLHDSVTSCKSLHSLTLFGGCFTRLHSGLLDAVKCYTQLRSLQLSRVEISFDNISLLFIIYS